MKKKQEEEEKEAKRLAAEAAKEAKRLAAELAKKEKLAAEKAEKEKERLAKEQEKAAKKAAAELAKKEKETKLASKTAAAPEPVVEEEPDVVKKITYEDKKYLKSKKTGIIYDYNEYVTNGEQIVVGKWNELTNKIDFTADEEAEEDYDM